MLHKYAEAEQTGERTVGGGSLCLAVGEGGYS